MNETQTKEPDGKRVEAEPNPMDFRLPSGKRLGDANKAEIIAAAAFYRKRADGLLKLAALTAGLTQK